MTRHRTGVHRETDARPARVFWLEAAALLPGVLRISLLVLAGLATGLAWSVMIG